MEENLRKATRTVTDGTPHRALEAFIQSELCAELAEAILDYTTYLILLDRKKKQLEADAKSRGIKSVPKLLKSELDLLQLKMKRMSDKYGRLLITHKSVGELTEKEKKNCSSQYEFRTKIMINDTSDQLFYEFLIKLLIATLKKAFPSSPENQETVAEEVSRLFRGNCFNSSKREHELLRHREKYPILKEDLTKNLNIGDARKRYEFIDKMQDRARIPK